MSQATGPCGKACLGWAAAKRYQEPRAFLFYALSMRVALSKGEQTPWMQTPVLGKVTLGTAPPAAWGST